MGNQASRVQRRALALLAAGAVLGMALGVVSAFNASGPHPSVPSEDAIALVNGKAVTKEDYARAVAMVASDKRTAVTDADRTYVLDRLIDEELLIQYGIDVGLVESDRAVRKAITEAMLSSVITEHTSERPSDDMLRAFYAENLSVFVRSAPKSDVRTTAGGGGAPPPFDEIKERVEEVYLHRARDDALRQYLAWLRSEAEIVLVSDSLPSLIEGEGQEGEYDR